MNIQVRQDKETGMYVGTDLDTGVTAKHSEPYGARMATEVAVALYEKEKKVEDAR